MTAPSEELQQWAAKQQRTRDAYFRILFGLYLEDRLPAGYIAPHLRTVQDDPRLNTAPGSTTPKEDHDAW